MKHLKSSIASIIFCSILFSCDSHSKKAAVSTVTYRKEKLDSTSEYEITIPNYYRIQKKQGVDFEVYSLCPSDTGKNFTNGGIYFGGHPQRIAPLFEIHLKKDSSRSGILLGNKIDWTIYEYDSLFSAQAVLNLNDYLKIHAFTYATSYSQLDTLIRIMESLNKR
jgi:hypothetical protein